jgi:L,D-transpeptidase ErfK/SrfK
VNCLAFLLALGATGSQTATGMAAAETRALPEVLGVLSYGTVGQGETLLDVALRHRVGFAHVERLNPGIDVWLPEPDTLVLLPTAMILPDAPHDGLVINVPEMRLYDFTVGSTPEIFAISIGDDADTTPEGDFRIGRKRTDPTWYVPASIRTRDPELPAQVPPGPDNPLGDRWMTIGNSSYGIHGTNTDFSIGRITTHGCIRLYNDDIRRLYERIPEGTPVHLVYQPVKVGARGGEVFLEVHPDVYGRRDMSAERVRLDLVVKGMLGQLDAASLDPEAIERAVGQARGVPVKIGRAKLIR